MKHTNGPWHVDTSNGEWALRNSTGEIVFLIGDNRRLIPTLDDRKLIAAAPELLEALQAVRTWLIAPSFDTQTLAEVQRIAEKAIAKATE